LNAKKKKRNKENMQYDLKPDSQKVSTSAEDLLKLIEKIKKNIYWSDQCRKEFLDEDGYYKDDIDTEDIYEVKYQEGKIKAYEECLKGLRG
tara:strand:+ start:18144 stop:18416 length:273 start_codon:yes stop_codon:yes gene_type:complete